MANRITTLFEFREQGSGISKIKNDVREAEGAIGKMKAGWKGAVDEFKGSRAAQAAAFGALVTLAKQGVDAASNLKESVNAVEKSYGLAADGVLALGENSAEAFGMSKRELNEFSVRFSAFAKQIADSDGRRVVDVVGEMAGRIADFASVHNLSLEEAARVAQSTLAGETEVFRRFGGDVSAATVKTHAYETGIADLGSELTEQQKILARYSLFMEQTANTAGDFADTSDDLANASRTLSANWENLAAMGGDALLPVISELTAGMNDMIAAGQDLGLISISDAVEVDKLLVGTKGLGDITSGLEAFGEVAGWFSKGPGADTEERLERLGDGADILSGVLEETEEATDALAQANERSEAEVAAHGAALGTLDSELRQIRSNTAKVTDETDDYARAAEDAARQTEALTARHKRLKDQLSDRSAYLGVEQAFEDLEAAAKAASTASETGSDNAAAASRDHELAVLDLRGQVADYISDVGNIPASTLTQIDTFINNGQYQQALAQLRELERTRTSQINIRTYYAAATGPGMGAQGRPSHTGSRITPGEIIQPLSGQGFIADAPGRVVSREDLAGMSDQHGTRPAQVINNTVTIKVDAAPGTDMTRAGQQIADALESFLRNGGRPPASLDARYAKR